MGFGLLEKHINLINALEKCKGALLFEQVSNHSDLGCALNGLFPREIERAEDGVQMILAEVHHLNNTKPALLMPFLAAVVEL